jgi:hypothetical protein
MAYSVIIAGAIAAKHIDAFVKSAKSDSIVENGNIITLSSVSTASGENEVYVASTPATATLATDVFYMVNDSVNVLVNSIYAGLVDDPREFNIAAAKVFSCYKPMVGDEIVISEDGFSSTRTTETHAIPANGSLELAWSSSISAVSLAYQYLEGYNIPIGSERLTGYKLLCVKAS